MTAASELTATSREILGKANRRLGKDAVPAVLYGPGRDPLPIAIDRHDFELFASHHAAGATLVDLQLEGEKKPVHAMIRDIQHSPLKGTILHVDFMEVQMNKPVSAVVTLSLVNDPEGVKAGGVLTVSLHELNVEAKPGDLPEVIEVDVSGLELNHSIHVSDITAPAGVTITDDGELIVASVQPPRTEEAEEAVLEESEPVLIGKDETEE